MKPKKREKVSVRWMYDPSTDQVTKIFFDCAGCEIERCVATLYETEKTVIKEALADQSFASFRQAFDLTSADKEVGE